VCSLCVNLYRIKYGIKENDLHEIISKSCLDLLNQDLIIKTEPVEQSVEIKTENHEPSEQSIHAMECEKVDSLNCINVTHNNNNNESPNDLDGQPPRKKHKMDFSLIFEVLKRKENRESLKIIPKMQEVFVTPVVSEMQIQSMLKRDYGINHRRDNSSHALRPVKRDLGIVRIHPSKRYISRGSRSWLHKNKRSGFKCHSFLCHERVPFRYPRKIGVILHKLWHHHKPNYKCDYCDLKFCHLYQAFLHKKNCHSTPPSNHLFLDNHHEERAQFFQDTSNRTIEFHL